MENREEQIDLSVEFHTIIAGKERWWADESPAREQLAALHGAVLGKNGLNEHGVFVDCEKFTIGDCFGCQADIALAETPAGHWLMTVSFQIADHDRGSLPSISDHKAFTSRDAALQAGLEKLLIDCDDHIYRYNSHGGQYEKPARRLRRLAREELESLKQPALL
jgi:hypothetical protein